MAKYQNRTVKLNKPFRTPSAAKKFGVYVQNNKTNKVKLVRFGQKGMTIKSNIAARQRSFMARFKPILDNVKGQKNLSAAYWAVRSWQKGFKI